MSILPIILDIATDFIVFSPFILRYITATVSACLMSCLSCSFCCFCAFNCNCLQPWNVIAVDVISYLRGHFYRGRFFLVDVFTVDIFPSGHFYRGHFFRGRFFRGRYFLKPCIECIEMNTDVTPKS